MSTSGTTRMDAGGRAMSGASYCQEILTTNIRPQATRFLPLVGMTQHLSSRRQDDCTDTGGRVMQELLPRDLGLQESLFSYESIVPEFME